MTAVDPEARPQSPAVTDDTAVDRLGRMCPYLAAAGGTWRSASVAREHRCGAVAPPAPVAAEMQRRLCLTAEHLTCPAFEAARAARPIVPERMRTLPRPLARTTPVVLDHGRIALTLPAWRLDRSIRQGVLVVFMGLAFVAILLAKLTGGGTTAAAVDASPSANPSVLPSSAPSLAGGDATPLATTAAIVSAAPTSGTLAATSPPAIRTYKVKAGDTLVGIAARFKTTPKALATLNGITNASSLKVGQTLKLP